MKRFAGSTHYTDSAEGVLRLGAARNVSITVINKLRDTEFHLMESYLDHGVWNVPPPQCIGVSNSMAGNNVGAWSTQSDGFATGTHGWVRYAPFRNGKIVDVPPGDSDSKDICMEWGNPHLGSDTYQCSASHPYIVAMIGANTPTITGDDDSLTFELTESETHAAIQGSAPQSDKHTYAPGNERRDDSGASKDVLVFVKPEQRQHIADENAASVANAGKPIYVKRRAFPGDNVWVTIEQARAAQAQNATALSTPSK